MSDDRGEPPPPRPEGPRPGGHLPPPMPGGGFHPPAAPDPLPPGPPPPLGHGRPHAAMPDRTTPLLVYILHLAAFVFAPLAVAALVVAYANRDRGDPVADGHYAFAIRTFWLGLLYIAALWGLLVAMLLALGVAEGSSADPAAGPLRAAITLLVVGSLAQAVWWAMRCVRGLIWLRHGRPVPHPETWLW